MQQLQPGLQNNNVINIIGRVASDFVFSHEVFSEGFYNFNAEVRRLSDNSDLLPITISDRLTAGLDIKPGQITSISGQIRSYNSYIESEGRNRLVLTIFAKEFAPLEDENAENLNDVYLNGYVCKPPIYRTTPFGREIADLLLAVNRSYNKSDYIPCIAWGRNAHFAGKFSVGDNVRVWGRMQSRIYQKKQPDGSVTERTAFEVSIAKLERDAKPADPIADVGETDEEAITKGEE
ncbi:MAG: single-stranded DNA-binding protein [Clostridiales bacterium]|jgi:single-stranded DNA-binding protein|nr:single-stranded DNA-binding protein [Clostridiales bacterium]